MGQVSAKLRRGEDGFSYWCQGCEEPHGVKVPGWSFDGDLVRPTFSPSVLVTSGHYTPGWAGSNCWCTYSADLVAKGGPPSAFTCYRCHTFIQAGMVRFLGDCTHALAGLTLDLPDLPEHLRDA